jgi:hypothetical protein
MNKIKSMRFILILHTHSDKLPYLSIPFRVSDFKFVCISKFSLACYMYRPFHPAWFDCPKNVRLRHKLWNHVVFSILQLLLFLGHRHSFLSHSAFMTNYYHSICNFSSWDEYFSKVCNRHFYTFCHQFHIYIVRYYSSLDVKIGQYINKSYILLYKLKNHQSRWQSIQLNFVTKETYFVIPEIWRNFESVTYFCK